MEHKNPHAYIEKPTHLKRVTFWSGFWSRGIIGPFFFENEKGEPLNKFLYTKIEQEGIGNIRTALRATQLKLHSMFCALFLKIALSAAELMSFRHLGAAI